MPANISKFAGTDAPRVRGIFNQIPGQLAMKEKKKYFFSSVNADARMREYAESFNWLEESRIVSIARDATDPSVALAISEDYDTQKLYAADTGLLVTQAFESRPYTENEIYHALLFDRLSVNEGMVAENVVAQSLTVGGNELFFYSRNGKQGDVERMEIDFLPLRCFVKNRVIARGSFACPAGRRFSA